ncbi:unnamed protein product [Cuscuta epithymum]|uniref:Uncharacterized protein n=1 Tax=Cuscuta epithymum TaxID=186058 RepID=A0AAV0EZK7_9ASTE|nr:unnamed protein product [Cuscuta epithymum]
MATLVSASLNNPFSYSHIPISSSQPVLLFPNFLHLTTVHRHPNKRSSSRDQRGHKAFAKNSSKNEEEEDPSIPSWAKPGSQDPPPWARDEPQKESLSFEIPFYVYLLASSITAIAAVGSVFEYVNQKPVFGLLNSDSVFYTPLLGFFAFSGIPTSAYLWFKSVEVANKESDELDKRDGYL